MADYYSRQRRKNITVGLFVVLGICAFVYMVALFQDLPIAFTKARSFEIKVQFPSSPGISENTPIRFCGYEIGRVTSVSYPQLRQDVHDPNLTYHQSLVIMSINKKHKDIPSNVEIKIMKRGLGSSYIEMSVDPLKSLEPLVSGKPETVYLCQDCPVFQGFISSASEFFPEATQKKAEEMVDNFSVLLKNANIIIGDESNQQNIKQLLANTSDAMDQATKTLEEIKRFTIAGESTFKNVSEQTGNLSKSITLVADELTLTLREMRNVLSKANSGSGSAAKLLNDGKFYENLLDSSEQLRQSLAQLRKLLTESRDNGIPLKLK